MPEYLFLDRDGNEVGVIRSETAAWTVGSEVARRSGRYRVLDVIEPILPDRDGMVAYVVVEPLQPT